MEANSITKKKLFICKFCNKKYPCGKSLGGHIRIHLNGNGSNANVNSTDVEEEAIKNFAAASGSNSKKDSDPEAGGQSGGYGLRENPKKTRRFMVYSTNTNQQQEKVCKECGKGFQSLKALCGHMASHSKNSFEDHSGTTEKLKDQIFDSQSDTETSSAPSMRRRSTRMRYKAIDVYSSSLSLPKGSLSSASDDIEQEQEQEQEEVAMCLMMLSKDSGFKGCFSSVADFSDNNSVVVEPKSSSPKLRNSVKNGINCVYNANGFLEMKKPKQQQVMPIGNDNSENSDSGYFRNGPKKVESEISVHGFTRNDELKKPKLEFWCRFEEEFNPELGKRLSRFRRIKTELGKNLIEEDGEYKESDRVSRKRSKNNDSYNPEFLSKKSSKTGKCPPIGAYRSSSHRTNGRSESIYESGKNSIDTDSVPNRKVMQSCNGKNPIGQNAEKKLGFKKGKVHECPFCFKVFRSGQALGGHKRSHFVGGAEDRTVVINQQVPEVSMSGLIDLNLPAPVEDDTNGYYLSSW